METVTIMNKVMETSKDIIIIDSDEEDNVDVSSGSNINNDKINESISDGIVSIVAVYSLVNPNELENNKKCDIASIEPGLVNDDPTEKDTTLPKIVAVTSGINVIHSDFTNSKVKASNNIEVSTNECVNSNVEYVDLKYKAPRKKKYLPTKMHIRNRIQHIINKQSRAFRKNKHYASIKLCIKNFPRRRRTHTVSIKKNIRRFNTLLPVKVNAAYDSQWNELIQEIKSLKKCDNVRTEIMEQLKIFREKCFKQCDSESALKVMDEFLTSMDAQKDTNETKNPQIAVEKDLKKHPQLKEFVPVPCCSKTLDDFTPKTPPPAVKNSLASQQENSAKKSIDLTKYKSLKYKLLINAKDTTNQQTDDPENKSTIDLVNDEKHDVSYSRNKTDGPPDIDDVLQRLRDMRHCVGKISEEDDILARLKSDRSSGQLVDDTDIELPNLDANELAREKVHKKDEPKSKMMVSKPSKSRNTAAVAPEDIAGPLKIALPNGRLVKPKTLAEKRRLLRREFESEMRGRMQVNEQLLERQLLRQKSNNRRTESSDVRERLLQDNAPMTRAHWNGVTELLSADTAFSKQFMIVDGRYVRICGSRGGETRFISPPPAHVRVPKRAPLNTHNLIDNKLIPRFLPGPMSKKHLLIRKTHDDGIKYCSKQLPKLFLIVQPVPGKPMCDAGKSYMKFAFASNIVDQNRAKFAVTALDAPVKKPSEAPQTYKFPVGYRNGQERILMRCLEEPNAISNASTDSTVAVENSTVVPSKADDKVVPEMISDMFDYVETSLQADDLIQDDPDAKAAPEPPSPPALSIEQSAESKSVASLRARAATELRRLNVTVIEASDHGSGGGGCKEPHCAMGCVCSSLKCLMAGAKRHCGNVECMFECQCEYTHRLRQKRSLRQDRDVQDDDDDMLELQDRVRSGLARVEAEFKHAVVVNVDKSVTLVDGDSDKRKRCVKMPKRFDDFISSDLMCHSQQQLPYTSPYASPVKKQDDYYELRRPVKTPIIPKEKLLPRKLMVRLHNLALEEVEPWCMVHELYRCFCDCLDAYGEPFSETKRRSSVDKSEQNESAKETQNSIKTLSRTILLDMDENDATVARKRNWHVELFSSDQEQVEPVAEKPQSQQPQPGKRKTVSRMSFSGFESDASSLRRKSNDSIKRKRSNEDVDKDKRETKDTMKRPRLQIKSPWDINQMANKMTDKMSKFNDSDSILLREFALSTTSVVDPNVKDGEDQKPSSILIDERKTKFENAIKQQRETHNRTMRCARTNDPSIVKIQSMIIRNRRRAGTQRRSTEMSEQSNPTLLRRLNLLVKRSQIVSQQRGLKTGNIIPLLPKPSNESKNVTSTAQNVSLPDPPPLKPAPVLQAAGENVSPKVVNMVASTLPVKEQKAMSTVVNREILRMLNQKGALDADFDLSKPWKYRFQCMQWHTMLCKYQCGEIRLWLEKSPEKSSTMALLTTGATPPFSNCIDMILLNAAAEKGDGRVYVPKFAKKIHTDCLNIGDAKHKAQYVFMRAHQTYWTLEGVIERGHNTKNLPVKNNNKQDYITIRPKSDLYADSENSVSPVRKRVQSNSIDDSSQSTPENSVDEQSYLLNAELLRTRTEIEACLVDPNKKKNERTDSPEVTYRLLRKIKSTQEDSDEQSPIELIPCKRPRRSVTHRFEKAQNIKRSHRNSPVQSKSNGPDAGQQSNKPEKAIQKSTDELPGRKTETPKADDNKPQEGKLDNLLLKRPFTIEKINKVNGLSIYELNDGNDEITIIKQRKRMPICKNDDKLEDEEPQVQISNVSSTNEVTPPANLKLEALPFVVGMRYLFVSMNETFGLLTSSRNGYRVTYLQLASAIQTAICRNVYVRLKFKQNELNHDAHGVVFAVPWCKDGVFIGPYGLTEQCMITKQIYWRSKLIGLSEYTRTIENREPKPVGYWMCYYGDDQKFVRAYHSLMKRLNVLDKKPEAMRDEIAENKKVVVKVKGSSPNSVLKANLDKIRARISSPSADEAKLPVLAAAPNVAKLATSSRKATTVSALAKSPAPTKRKTAIAELFNDSPLSSNDFEMQSSAEEDDALKQLHNTNEKPKSTRENPPSNYIVNIDVARAAPSPDVSSLSNMSNVAADEINESSIISDVSNAGDTSANNESATTSTLTESNFTTEAYNTANNTSDDESELIIEEKVPEVIDLSSDSEDGNTAGFGDPGMRWLYCDVEGIGYLEVQVLSNDKLSIQLPMVSKHAEFDDFKKATAWINSILKKIVYFLPNSFLPTWKMADSISAIKKMSTLSPRKMGTDIFQGNFVIYKHTLIDLSNQKNIDERIKDPNDHAFATKYAEHYISRYIKHALGLKFASRLSQEQLAAAACTEIKSINDVEAKLVDQKKTLLKQRKELVQQYKALNITLHSNTDVKTLGIRTLLKNFNSPKTDKVDAVSSNLIVIDD